MGKAWPLWDLPAYAREKTKERIVWLRETMIPLLLHLKENSFIPTKFHPLTRLWIVVATCYRVNMADNVLKIRRQLRAIQVRERDALLPSWQLWCWGKSCSAMIVAVSEDLESEKVSWWLVGM